MNDLEAYCRADVELTQYSRLWWDVYHWVRDTMNPTTKGIQPCASLDDARCVQTPAILL